MNTFYVYLLIDPFTFLPFYVGKGSGERWKSHVTESHKPIMDQSNPYKCNILRNIERRGGIVECAKIPTGNEETAYMLEQRLISHYGKRINGTGILTNILDGGQTGSTSRPVVSYCSRTGNFVESFDSLSSASEKLRVRKSDISLCLSGKQRTAKGYIFRDGREITERVVSYSRNCAVDVYVVEQRLRKIGSYPSTHKAAHTLGVNQSLVHNALIKKQKLVHNKFLVVASGDLPEPYIQTVIQSHHPKQEIDQTYRSLAEAVKETGIDRSGIIKSIKNPGTRRAGGYFWNKKVLKITT